MKQKSIEDKTYKTYIILFWDCTEKEFVNYWNKKYPFKVKESNSLGKTIISTEKGIKIGVWINRKNNFETLSHELIHVIYFWLSEIYGIKLNKDTEEIYTLLHSFYMGECLKALGFKKYMSNN